MKIVSPPRPLLSRIFFHLSLAFEKPEETPEGESKTIRIEVPKHWDREAD